MCVDLREPNKAIIVDLPPLDPYRGMHGATVFSTTDLASAV